MYNAYRVLRERGERYLLTQVSGPVVHLESQVSQLLLLLPALTHQVGVERLVVANPALR